jgi:hypothetical protein
MWQIARLPRNDRQKFSGSVSEACDNPQYADAGMQKGIDQCDCIINADIGKQQHFFLIYIHPSFDQLCLLSCPNKLVKLCAKHANAIMAVQGN